MRTEMTMSHTRPEGIGSEPEPLETARQRVVDALDDLGTAISRLTAEMRRATRLFTQQGPAPAVRVAHGDLPRRYPTRH